MIQNTKDMTVSYGDASIQLHETPINKLWVTSFGIMTIGTIALATSKNTQYNPLFIAMMIGGVYGSLYFSAQ
jgi:energy-converting hydrogenase Eha subunit C